MNRKVTWIGLLLAMIVAGNSVVSLAEGAKGLSDNETFVRGLAETARADRDFSAKVFATSSTAMVGGHFLTDDPAAKDETLLAGTIFGVFSVMQLFPSTVEQRYADYAKSPTRDITSVLQKLYDEERTNRYWASALFMGLALIHRDAYYYTDHIDHDAYGNEVATLSKVDDSIYFQSMWAGLGVAFLLFPTPCEETLRQRLEGKSEPSLSWQVQPTLDGFRTVASYQF
jgi:hypothetical protein